MATITLTLTSGPVTGSKNYTWSDADVTRLIAAYRTIFRMPAATNGQVLIAWADDMIDSTKRAVKSVEAQAATPADIAVT